MPAAAQAAAGDMPLRESIARILEAGPEADFDDLLHLAAQLAGCPWAALCLLDGQVPCLKAALGPASGSAPAHALVPDIHALDPTFFAHAATVGETLLVEDAQCNALLRGSPLVSGPPHIRFYAGLPLLTDGQRAIGALCLLDTTARSLEPQVLAMLAALARQAMRLLTLRAQAHALELRMTEAQMRSGDERFRIIFELSAVGIAMVDMRGRWKMVNARLCEMLGYSEQELYSGDFQRITHPDDLPHNLALVSQLVSGERDSDVMEKRYYRKDGSIIWVRMAVAAVRQAESGSCYFISVIEDISAHKQAELQLRESEFRYRQMFVSSPQPMWVGDRETLKFIDVNAAAIAHYGYSREEFLSFDLVDLRVPERRDEPLQALVAPAQDEPVRSYARQHRRKDGSVIHAVISVQWIDYQDRPAIVVLVNDVTALVEAELRTRRINAELETRVAERTARLEMANQELAAFSYSVAHDLRSPLRSMHGFGMLLLESEAQCLSQEGRGYLRRIMKSSELMAEIIDDLLEYARVERDVAPGEPLELAPLCQEVVDARLNATEGSSAEVTVQVPPGRVQATRKGLSIVLRNLLDNALKFSRDGQAPRVEIGARLDGGLWTLWVRDNGIGFDMVYEEKIFQMFHRLNRADTYAGTGIGLALVRKAMQRMGGEVWAQSQPGAGATFYVRLPAAD